MTPKRAVTCTIPGVLIDALIFPSTGITLLDSNSTHTLALIAGSNLTANRSLTFVTGDATRTLTVSGDATLSDWFDQSVKTTSSPTFGGLSLSSPLGYTSGGTDASTQAGSRINLGGAKGFADGAALQAGAADYAGQLCYTNDGVSWSIARSTSAGDTDNDAVCLNNLVYFTHINAGSSTFTGALTATSAAFSGNVSLRALTATSTAAAGGQHILDVTGAVVDNTLAIRNSTVGGYSAIAFYTDTDANPGSCAIGVNRVGSQDYTSFYIATNPPLASPTTAPRNIVISQERQDVSTYTQHRRIFFDATNKEITAYGWTNDTLIGPVGWYIASDGRMGVGTSTLTASSQLTVSGTVSATLLKGAADISYQGLTIRDSDSSHRLTIFSSSNLTDDRSINFITGDASRTITIGGNVTFPNGNISVGFLNIPTSSKSADYTTVIDDSGKQIYHPASDNNARTFTIDGSLSYPIGTAITFVNWINTVTISISTDAMTLFAGSGTGTTGSRTLAAGGKATAVKDASGIWSITGVGLT